MPIDMTHDKTIDMTHNPSDTQPQRHEAIVGILKRYRKKFLGIDKKIDKEIDKTICVVGALRATRKTGRARTL